MHTFRRFFNATRDTPRAGGSGWDSGGAWKQAQSAWKCCRIVKSLYLSILLLLLLLLWGTRSHFNSNLMLYHKNIFTANFGVWQPGIGFGFGFGLDLVSFTPCPPLYGFAFEVCTTQKPQNLINVAAALSLPRRRARKWGSRKGFLWARLTCSASASASAQILRLLLLAFWASGKCKRFPLTLPSLLF